jgi:transcription initiation factor TFIID TATA-box-binding protein
VPSLVHDDDDDDDDDWTADDCKLRVNNYVATTSLRARDARTGRSVKFKLNLAKLARAWFRTCHYNDSMFPSVGINFVNPKCVVKISSNGEVVSTGARSRINSVFILRCVARRLSRALRLNVVIHDITVHNIAGSAALPRCVDIEGLTRDNADTCINNREKFSGATVRLPNLAPITALVFSSGKIVIAGAKDDTQLRHAFHAILEVVRPYCTDRRPPAPAAPGKRAVKRERTTRPPPIVASSARSLPARDGR